VIASEVTFGVNFLAISLETLRCAQQLTKLFMFLYQKGVRSQKISHQVALSAVHWQVAPHFAHLGLGADQYKQAVLDEEQAEAVLHAEIWQLTSHWTTREDRQRSATQRLVTSQDSTTKKASIGFVAPKAGDLVIMKDFGWFQQKGRKLDPRWKHSHKAYNIPFIVEKLSKNGSSAYIRGPHDPPGHTKRIHISDLRVYRPRNLDEFPSAPPAVHYARDCFAGVPPGSLGTGTKALDLSDLM
jgi:hypothetical protein